VVVIVNKTIQLILVSSYDSQQTNILVAHTH